MRDKIHVGICGYGNLGKGAQKAISKSSDMELDVIFTRRDPKEIENEANVMVCSAQDMEDWKDKLDVVIMCGGSAKDLPSQVTMFAKFFNTVDSFDTHADIPKFFENVNTVAVSSNHVSVISVRMGSGDVFC